MLPLIAVLVFAFLDVREHAIAVSDNDRVTNSVRFAVMLAAVLLAFLTAWFVTDFLVVRRVEALLRAAERLAAGDLAARAPTLPGLRKWSQLAAAFNRMAAALQEREKQLRAEESRFRSLVEQLPALTYLARLDKTSSAIYISPQVELILGVTAADWLADPESWVKHLHPDDRPRVLAELEQCHASGMPFCSEYRLVTRDGRTLWFRDQGAIVRDEKGNPLFLQGALNDISEHIKAETALLEQARLLDLTHDAIFVRDMDKRVVFWNRGAEELYGWTKEHALGRHSLELLHTEFPENPDDVEAEIAREGRWEGELVHTGQDGRRIVVASRWSLQRDNAGNPIAILETNNDITERRAAQDKLRQINAELELRVAERTAKLNEANAALLSEIAEHARAEDALRASEERFRLLAENACDLIYRYRLTPEARFEYVSPSATAITGYTPEEHYADPELGIRIVQLEDRPLLERALRGEINPNVPLVLRWTRKDGATIWIEQVNTPILDASGRLVAIEGIARDITERRRTEEELAEANKRLKTRADEVEQRNRELGLLNVMGDMLESCLTVQEAYSVLAQSARKLFPDDDGLLYAMRTGSSFAEVVTAWGDIRAETVEPVLTLDDCWALRRGRTHVVQDMQSDMICRHVMRQPSNGLPQSYTCAPLIAQSELLGVLHLSSKTGPLPESRQRLAVTVAEHLALTLSSLRLRERLQEQAIRDPLTGLYNRRYLTESLERELRRAQRRQNEVGVIMLDLDHFKQVNDHYGHDVGDALLRALAEYLQRHVRGEDIVCRYGGEEFTLILPDATMERARERAEQLCQGIIGLTVQHENQTYSDLSASFGVAVFPKHGSTAEMILKAADAALGQAKVQGRRRVVVAPSP